MSSIVQLALCPPGRGSPTFRPVTSLSAVFVSFTVNPICEPGRAVGASAVFVIVTNSSTSTSCSTSSAAPVVSQASSTTGNVLE